MSEWALWVHMFTVDVSNQDLTRTGVQVNVLPLGGDWPVNVPRRGEGYAPLAGALAVEEWTECSEDVGAMGRAMMSDMSATEGRR